MALQVTDLHVYRHRRETKREQDLRLEVTTLADEVARLVTDCQPSMRRLWLVAREFGPAVMADWSRIAHAHERIAALTSTDDAA